MEDKQLLSVSEFAEVVGTSKQAVYKRLNNSLKPFVVVVEGKKYIDRAVLTEEQKQKVEQPFNPKVEQVEQPFNPNFQPILEKQIEEKDKQIERLFQQIEEKDKQIETLQNLLNQSQQLLAIDRKLLLEKENQKKKRKGILKLFSRKETADNERNI